MLLPLLFQCCFLLILVSSNFLHQCTCLGVTDLGSLNIDSVGEDKLDFAEECGDLCSLYGSPS